VLLVIRTSAPEKRSQSPAFQNQERIRELHDHAAHDYGEYHGPAFNDHCATDTKQYDQTTSSVGVPTLTSGVLQGSDTVTWTQTFDTKNVGTGKTLTPAGLVSDGNGGNNYSYTYTPVATGVITAKALTVSGVTANNKVYDAGTVASLNLGSAAFVGVIGGDTVTINTGSATGAFGDKNVGTGKTVTVSGISKSGADQGNYTITQPTTTANITARPLTITAATDTKQYDQTTSSVGVPTLTSGVLQEATPSPGPRPLTIRTSEPGRL